MDQVLWILGGVVFSLGFMGWDLALAKRSAYVPSWYPILCVGTDIFLAGYITALIWPRH